MRFLDTNLRNWTGLISRKRAENGELFKTAAP